MKPETTTQGAPGRPERGASSARVLYRCPTRTNFLCPCGAVERRLRRLGLVHGTERVPYRRGERPEIVELTGQKHVPVLVDGREVVSDSRRILEYLDWAYGDDDEPGEAAAGERDETAPRVGDEPG